MLERKLASIQEIKDINPIPNADAIEVATILGWKVVIKKGEGYHVGDKVVYCEIDSKLPPRPEYEFLANYNYRVRTQKFRGQVSQGLVLPMSILPEGDYEVGDDVTAILGVEKYEIPLPMGIAGDIAGPFPGFIQKTDETRIQILGDILPKYNGIKFYVTEKVDGTSITLFNRKGDIGVCTRNNRMKDAKNNAPWNVLKKLGAVEKIAELNNIAIQGELIGWNIQGNKYKLKTNEYKFYLFNVFDITNYRPFPLVEMLNIAKQLGLNTVPIIDDEYILDFDVDALVEMSKGQSIVNPQVRREGLVFKSVDYIEDMTLGRLSFKVINPDFLIKYGD